MSNTWLRGNTYWFRMRRPKRYAGVHGATHITMSLKTDSLQEAKALATVLKRQVMLDLDARLAGTAEATDREAYESNLALAKAHGRTHTTVEDLANAPTQQFMEAISYVMANDPKAETALFSAVLGGYDLPGTTISELAEDMERLLEPEIRAKNQRQRRVWKNKWVRAADSFVKEVQNKPVTSVTKEDAYKIRRHWKDRVVNREVETAYANKHLGYLETMVDAFYDDLEIDEYPNPFVGIRLEEKQPWEVKEKDNTKPEFKPNWIRETIITPGKLDILNDEARDILIVMAETGCRASEVYDTPAASIYLDHPIPHISIKVEVSEMEGSSENNRDVKTQASIRNVPLIGAALDAMKRHPDGFPRYRGNANFSNTAMKYFRDHNLMPSPEHKISSLRHSFESRMRRGGIDNEERGQLMGHSLKKIRGREVYGDKTDLQLRALFTEMVAFPTDTWNPRPKKVLRAEIDRILEEEGYKRSEE
ncbi:MAG: DUF6538 domain-containing protein [Paracoccaceae bacterium]